MEYTFTSQMSYMDDPITSGTTEGFGLMFFNARWLDPQLGRFAQADSIVPTSVQGLDRYAYVNNNPISYTDSSGHEPKPCWATKVYSCNLTNEDMDKLSLGTSAERKFLVNYLKERGVLQGFIRIDVTSGILMWNAGTQDANIVVKDFLKTLNDASLGDIIGSAISIPGEGLPIAILNSLISIFSSAGDDQLQDFIDNTTSYIDVVQDDQPNSTLVMTYTFRETTSCGSDGNCDTTFNGALTVGIIQEADRNSILLTGTKATYFEEWFRKMVEGR
jgi:RHS repeat-associated protein